MRKLFTNTTVYSSNMILDLLNADTQWLPWQVLHSTRGYCGSPGTVGTADTYCRVLWVLQGTVCTVGTARAKVTVGYCGSTRGYCRVLWVLWVLHRLKVTVGYCGSTRGYCRVLWVL